MAIDLLMAAEQTGWMPELQRGLVHYSRQHQLPWRWSIGTAQEVCRTVRQRTLPVAGVVGVLSPTLLDWAMDEGLPIAAFGAVVRNHPRVGEVRLDDESIGRLAAAHFHQQGIRRVVGYRTQRSVPTRDLRQRAFVAACQRFGLEVIEDIPVMGERRRAEDAERALTTWLAGLDGPIGLFSYQDHEARWLLQLCLTHGVAVPDQIAILGCDNDPAVCLSVSPSLSSVVVPWARVGWQLGLQIHRQLGGGPVPPPVSVSCLTVQARQSTTRLTDDPLVMRAIERQEADLAAALPVDRLATWIGVAPRTLHQRFVTTLGLGPQAWLQRRRLLAVEEAVRGSDRPLAALARVYGFASPSSMGQAFHCHFGMPPSTYRSLCRSGSARGDDPPSAPLSSSR